MGSLPMFASMHDCMRVANAAVDRFGGITGLIVPTRASPCDLSVSYRRQRTSPVLADGAEAWRDDRGYQRFRGFLHVTVIDPDHARSAAKAG